MVRCLFAMRVLCFQDLVFQRSANKAFNEDMLKEEARKKRGNGVHSKVSLCLLNLLHLRRTQKKEDLFALFF